MPGVRKPPSFVARNLFGGQQQADNDNDAFHSTTPIPGTNREKTSTRRKRGRELRGAGGAQARPSLLVRILVRSFTDPRRVTLLVLTAVIAPALYFFVMDAHLPEGTTRRLLPRLFPGTRQPPPSLPLRS
ncbi:unnamed protein product, partial [Ectocarpus fasciculatus]